MRLLANRVVCAVTFAAVCVMPANRCWAECEPQFQPTYGTPYLNGAVRALALWDDDQDGQPSLYIGGRFTQLFGAQPANRIARFDGTSWSAVPGGVSGSVGSGIENVRAMAVFDDGNGEALYVGGDFDFADGQPIAGLAKWDGQSWSAVPGFQQSPNTAVHCMTIFDSGNGPELIIGGIFNFDGIQRIARWNGQQWSGMTTGLSDFPNALHVHDDTGGANPPSLFVTGRFTSAGDVPNTARIAKWDGQEWHALNTGLGNSEGRALATFNGDLIVGGAFTIAGGVTVNRIARWDGEAFHSMNSEFQEGNCFNRAVKSLFVASFNGESVLCVGGMFTGPNNSFAQALAIWDGSTWSYEGDCLFTGDFCEDSGVLGMTMFDDQQGEGEKLFLAGSFGAVDDVATRGIVAWNGAQWQRPNSEQGADDTIRDFAIFNDGSGPALYACGEFAGIGSAVGFRVGRWDGSRWHDLDGGSWDHNFPILYALEAHDDGSGPALYAGGTFNEIGGHEGLAVSNIARWDGQGWADVGGGWGAIRALLSVDDGTLGGPQLYAGGGFLAAGNIARWDGVSWHPLSTGVNNLVHALAAFDDGSGLAVYAGGSFTLAGGSSANHVARWSNGTWSSLDAGLNSVVHALAVHNDGNGPALYAGGTFTASGGVSVSNIAKWDGKTWSAVGSGLNGAVIALASHDDNNDGVPSLFAGGSFLMAGTVSVNRIAKWDGTNWVDVSNGVTGAGSAISVRCLHSTQGSSLDNALFIGGLFSHADGISSSNIAEWSCVPTDLCPADIAPDGGNGNVDVDDLLVVINNWGALGGAGDITGNQIVDVDDLLAVINAWGPCK